MQRKPRQVLSISSQVAAGPVGNSAIVPTLLALGIVPLALSTIVLSNHPGHGRPEGLSVPADKLGAMLERLLALGFIEDGIVVLTGYFADEKQIDAVADIISGLPRSHYLCDPVLGDATQGLYVPEAVARGIRDQLLPLADTLTPNTFELSWLTSHDVHDIASARLAARRLAQKSIVVTSIPDDRNLTTALFEGETALAVTRPRLDQVPNGTGDLLAGLLAGRLALGHPLVDSIGFAVAATEQVIAASAGTASLDLARGLPGLAAVKAFAARHE
jgi:pyridoxine kinase